MGGGASIVSTLADLASLGISMFFLMAALRAMAEGKPTGLVTPEAGYDVICSTLDFAQASFGLVGTLFLATAALKASGMAKVAGWFLLIGLPISIFQVAEVGLHTPWTVIIDAWVNPVDEIIQQIVIGIALFAVLRRHQNPPGQRTEINRPPNPRFHTPGRAISARSTEVDDAVPVSDDSRAFQLSPQSCRFVRSIP